MDYIPFPLFLDFFAFLAFLAFFFFLALTEVGFRPLCALGAAKTGAPIAKATAIVKNRVSNFFIQLVATSMD